MKPRIYEEVLLLLLVDSLGNEQARQSDLPLFLYAEHGYVHAGGTFCHPFDLPLLFLGLWVDFLDVQQVFRCHRVYLRDVYGGSSIGVGLRGLDEYRLKEISEDMNFSMPFLGNLVTYTKMMVFGTESCVLCKPYWKSLSNKSLHKRAKWKKYFNNLVKYSKMCFQ